MPSGRPAYVGRRAYRSQRLHAARHEGNAAAKVIDALTTA